MPEPGDPLSGVAHFRNLQLVWASLVGGVVMYTAVAALVITMGDLRIEAIHPSVVNLVAAGVTIYTVGVTFLRRPMISRFVERAEPDARWAAYARASIAATALVELGGLIVITLGLMSGSTVWVLAGGGASAGLIIIARPRPDELGGRRGAGRTSTRDRL